LKLGELRRSRFSCFFFSSRRRHTRSKRDWSSDVCSSDLTLVATIIFNMFLRGFSSMIPVLLGIIVGYIFAVFMGIVDLSGVAAAKWFSLPAFDVMFVNYDFKWYPGAII